MDRCLRHNRTYNKKRCYILTIRRRLLALRELRRIATILTDPSITVPYDLIDQKWPDILRKRQRHQSARKSFSQTAGVVF